MRARFFMVSFFLYSFHSLAEEQIQIKDFNMPSIQSFRPDGSLYKKVNRNEIPLPLPGFKQDLKDFGNGICLKNDKKVCFQEGDLILDYGKYVGQEDSNCHSLREESGTKGQGSCD